MAIKIIRVDKIKDAYIKKNLRREAKIMIQLQHPNIVTLHEVCAFQNHYCLVLDFWAGGSMCDYISQKEAGKLAEDQAQKLFKQILNGVEYIHSRNIVHRDIKLDNILTNKAGDHIVLGDFGLSNFLKPGQLLKTHCGSPEYSAPEVILTLQDYTKEVDVWSCGVALFCMVTGHLPFSGQLKGKGSLRSQIREGLTERHYKMLAGLSEGCRSLLHQILSVGVDVTQRPRVQQLQLFSWCFSLPAPKTYDLTHHQQLQVAKRLKDKLDIVEWAPANILGYVQSNRGKLGKTAGCFSLMAGELRQQEMEAQALRSPAATAAIIKPLPAPVLVDEGPGRFRTSNAARPVELKKDEKSARRSGGGKENKPSAKMMKTFVPGTKKNTQTGLGYIEEMLSGGGGAPGQLTRLKNAPHYDRLAVFAQPAQGAPQEAFKEDSAQFRNIKKRRRSSSTFGHHGVNNSRADHPTSGLTKPNKYLDKASQF